MRAQPVLRSANPEQWAYPSAFLATLYNINEKAVIQVRQERATAINKSVNYVLERLRINPPHFVEMLSQHPEENQ